MLIKLVYIVVLVQGRGCCLLVPIQQKPCRLYMVILRRYIKIKHPEEYDCDSILSIVFKLSCGGGGVQ